MKTIIRFLSLSAMAVLLVTPALARLNANALNRDAVNQAQQGDAEAKAALYAKVTENYKTNQKVAYEAAKEYLQKYPNEENQQIVTYLKNFVAKYEKAVRKQTLSTYISEKKWAEAFQLGKEIVNDEPENLVVALQTSWAGLQLGLSGNNANNSAASGIAQKAIQLIDAGKMPEEGKPYTNKEEDLGWLNFSLGYYALKNKQQSEAAGYFIKAVGHESTTKQNPTVYAQIATIYEDEYGRLQQQYDAQYKGKPETDESKAALVQVKQFLEPMIDAYARAVAYSGDNPAFKAGKENWSQRLKELYTFSKGSTDGLDALIASVKTKPIPPQPATQSLPTPAPATTTSTPTTTSTDAASGAKGATTTPATTGPGTAKPANTGQTGPLGTKPATTTTGSSTGRPRRN